MRSLKYLILAALVGLGVQNHAQAPADTEMYAVSYVDVMPSGRAAAIAALKQYRDASRKDDGYAGFELLEQVGWPSHFAVVETWRDQKALDAHGMAPHVKQFREALQPIRTSGYDQRPYKALAVAPAAAAANAQTVYIVAHVDIAGQGAQAEAPGMLRRLAESSRKQPGNLRFDVVQHAMRANHYTVVEAWQSQAARDAHASVVQTKEYRDVLQPMSGSPLDERPYKAIE